MQIAVAMNVAMICYSTAAAAAAAIGDKKEEEEEKLTHARRKCFYPMTPSLLRLLIVYGFILAAISAAAM